MKQTFCEDLLVSKLHLSKHTNLTLDSDLRINILMSVTGAVLKENTMNKKQTMTPASAYYCSILIIAYKIKEIGLVLLFLSF